MNSSEDVTISKELFYIEDLPYDLTKAENPKGVIKTIILIIPGNPGLVDFYEQFITHLLLYLDPSYAVWCVSHAGFSQKDCLTAVAPDAVLAGEVDHKLKFVKEKLPPDVDVILIGHSIGCYMILSLLKILSEKTPIDQENKQHDIALYRRVQKCYLLFPTIERMKVSPNGQRLLPVVNYLKTLCTVLAGLVDLLPYCIKRVMAYLYLPRSCHGTVIDAAVTLISAKNVRNMLQLAQNELSSVLEVDTSVIKANLSKLLIYYGKSDGWCPLYYRDELLESVPDLNNIVDNSNIPHAFVVSKGPKMASVLANLISS